MELNEKNISNDFIRSVDIHSVLPQQEPFVMVDVMTQYGKTFSSTETTIRESNIFVERGEFSANGMLENIAQTCASRIGFYNKYILRADNGLGFVGAVRNYEVKRCPKIGETISTTVEIIEDVFGMILADARIECNDEILATAKIKLSLNVR